MIEQKTSVVTDRSTLTEARAALPGTVAVVMTMGALHEGHAHLLRAAHATADAVVATVFVNPLQFGEGEDFNRYPRTLDDDLAVCEAAGVDLVFAPPASVMYPAGEPRVRVDPGPLGEIMEGASRPGHFAGVLTVVLKLLHLIRPDAALFGEKDYQQLALIREMVADLDLPVDVIGVPTVREPDGLALSSRNRYLSPAERRSALTLARALSAGAATARQGSSAEEVLWAALGEFDREPAVRLDYIAVTDDRLRPVTAMATAAHREARSDADDLGFDGAGVLVAGAKPARLLGAAWVGSTRLIDNVALENR